MTGKVYLVGAGPGDPDLLTVKAERLLRTAEAVLHDDLIAPEILRLIPRSAQMHDVGKRCGRKKILQWEINCLMVALAASGLRVVRLKSGDPLIFGRAGEEIEALRANGIPFEIVPGVSTAMAAAAATQIPLTHRRASSALVFLTAHESPEKPWADEDDLRWKKLAVSGATLAIYMPGRDYSKIARRLFVAGLDAWTPCAIISRASTPYQRAHYTQLGELTQAPPFAAPTLLIVGEVVGMAEQSATLSSLLSHNPLATRPEEATA